jgi:hypothetical protein
MDGINGPLIDGINGCHSWTPLMMDGIDGQHQIKD